MFVWRHVPRGYNLWVPDVSCKDTFDRLLIFGLLMVLLSRRG